jgi:hypothetical protein
VLGVGAAVGGDQDLHGGSLVAVLVREYPTARLTP